MIDLAGIVRLMQEKLIELVGKEVLVVQIDGRVYKGRVSGADEQILALTEVAETGGAGRDITWKTPAIVMPGEDDKPNQVELKEVLIPFSSIVRIWPLGEKKVEKVKKEEPKKLGAAQYVIRRIGSQ